MYVYYIIFAGDIFAVRYGRLKRKDSQFQNNHLFPSNVALDILTAGRDEHCVYLYIFSTDNTDRLK
jgi:hypothetical protein